MSNAIDKLKSEPSLLQPGCDTCRHRLGHAPTYWQCGVYGGSYTSYVWHKCRGDRWEPRPPPVPALVRLKRWLIG